VEGYGDGTITETYYARGETSSEALDKALTIFLKNFNLDFDTDIDNIEWSYCRI
jgi:hypothetical protein